MTVIAFPVHAISSRRRGHPGTNDLDADVAPRPADLTAYRRAVDDRRQWEARAHRVIDEVEALLSDGRGAEVAVFCDCAAAYLQASAEQIADHDALRRLEARLDTIRSWGRALPSR